MKIKLGPNFKCMLWFKSTRWTKYLKVSNSDRWNYKSNTRKKNKDWETDRGQRNCLYFWELSREERKNRGREEKEIEKMEAALIKGFWPTTWAERDTAVNLYPVDVATTPFSATWRNDAIYWNIMSGTVRYGTVISICIYSSVVTTSKIH